MGELTWIDELRDRAVRGELDRRHPERLALRPIDVAGVLAGFDAVDAMWSPTIARARGLPSSILHERVDGEYSFLETLRHLLFATDAWLTRVALRVSDGYHEGGVPPDLPPDAPPDTGPDLGATARSTATASSSARSGGTTGSPSATSPSSRAGSDHAPRGGRSRRSWSRPIERPQRCTQVRQPGRPRESSLRLVG